MTESKKPACFSPSSAKLRALLDCLLDLPASILPVMTPSESDPAASRKRRFPLGLLIAMLLGGIIFAVIDVSAVNRGLTFASYLADSFGGTAKPMKVSVTWFYGLLPIGEVEHPRVWAAAGGFIMGTIYGAVAFVIVRAVVRAIRKGKPLSNHGDGRSSDAK